VYFNHRIEQVFVCRIPFDIESFGSCQNLQRFHLAEKSGAEYLVTSQYTTLVLPQKEQLDTSLHSYTTKILKKSAFLEKFSLLTFFFLTCNLNTGKLVK